MASSSIYRMWCRARQLRHQRWDLPSVARRWLEIFLLTYVPEADIYLHAHILHDWNDGEAVQILKGCRQAMRPGDRIIVIEMLLGEIGEPGLAPLVDLNMMVMLTGRGRTLAEYCALLKDAGLRLSKSTPIRSPMAVIEAVAA
jgi:hypothetical protein